MTLRALLDRIGWSERHLAAELACHPNTVNDWANARRPIPRAVVAWLEELADHHERHPAPDWRSRDGSLRHEVRHQFAP